MQVQGIHHLLEEVVYRKIVSIVVEIAQLKALTENLLLGKIAQKEERDNSN